MRGNYSVKSDAFSFGVMVLEIMTGRKNNNCYNSQQSEDLLTTVRACLLARRLNVLAGVTMQFGSWVLQMLQIWEHWNAGTVLGTMDPCLSSSFSESEVLRCMHVGLLCVQGNPADRPVMSSVVMMLASETDSLSAPSKPSLYARNDAGADSAAASLSTVSMQDGPGESI